MIRLAAIAMLCAALLLAHAGDAQQAASSAAPGGNPLDVVPDKMPFDVP